MRLDFLDGLRGIAVLTVMTLHLWQISWVDLGPAEFLATSGMLGVNLFFFLSGFCLYLSYSRTPRIGDYVRKRAAKILPSYWLCLALVLVWLGNPFVGAGETLRQLAAHLFFVHNLWPETAGTINGVFWSLGVEIQFYVLFPLVFAAYRRRAVAVAIGLTLASLAFRLAVAGGDPAWLDFRMA
jgi:peptidoglycan/LPS O-acetylase OafA/YrhL